MTKASVNLQDLRRRIYVKAKAEKSWRFWGLYVHVCKMETLREAYALAKQNDGAPGVDGVTFEAIETQGVDGFLEQIWNELNQRNYVPLPARKQEIPKDGGKVRVLSIPAIRDGVVQGALKLILEPIFETDFQSGSYGYRPKRTAHQAVTVLNQIWEEDFLGFSYGFRPGRGQQDALDALSVGIVRKKVNWILDLDIRSFFDKLQHDWLVRFVEHRIGDQRVVRLIQKWLKAGVVEDG